MLHVMWLCDGHCTYTYWTILCKCMLENWTSFYNIISVKNWTNHVRLPKICSICVKTPKTLHLVYYVVCSILNAMLMPLVHTWLQNVCMFSLGITWSIVTCVGCDRRQGDTDASQCTTAVPRQWIFSSWPPQLQRGKFVSLLCIHIAAVSLFGGVLI